MKALLVLYNCNLNNFNNDYDLIIGIDRGAYNLASNNIKMDIAYGDFDSVNEAEFELIKKYSKKIVKLNPVKDLSDTYQVIKDYKDYDITILGGIYGKRIEHFYSNLLSLINYDNIKIMDENSLIIKCKKGVYKNNPNYKFTSIFGIEDSIITLKNFKYNLDNYKLNRFDPLCLSNEGNEDSIIEVIEGSVFVIYSKDDK